MQTNVTRLRLVPQADTTTFLTDEEVRVTAEALVWMGFEPEDVPDFTTASHGRDQVMGAMRRLARAS